MKTAAARLPSVKTSVRLAASVIATADAARTPLDAERAHMAYAVAKREMNTADAFRALGAVEDAQRRTRRAVRIAETLASYNANVAAGNHAALARLGCC